MIFSIRKAQRCDTCTVASMAANMWCDASFEELESEFQDIVAAPDQAVFLASCGGVTCGFAQCDLRRDYVEGTHGSPVGYLEGIYVKPEYRKMGCAGTLLSACENWAKDLGCKEFASDCELTNSESLRFHMNTGFQEANRIICFTKTL